MRRAAAGGVDDDRVDVRAFERGDQAAGKAARLVVEAGVQRQRAAATLAARRQHLAAFGREHANGRLVDVAEEHALDAAGHETDALPGRAGGGRAFRHGAHQRASFASGASAIRLLSRSGSILTAPEPPQDVDQDEREREQPQPRRIRQQQKQQAAEQPLAGRALIVMFDGGARFLDERRVAHAGRARGFARHAAETGVEVTDHGVGHDVHLGPALDAGLHHVDPAARRVHLLAEQQVARAGRQAEAAVDALVHQRVERGERCEGTLSHGGAHDRLAPRVRGPD